MDLLIIKSQFIQKRLFATIFAIFFEKLFIYSRLFKQNCKNGCKKAFLNVWLPKLGKSPILWLKDPSPNILLLKTQRFILLYNIGGTTYSGESSIWQTTLRTTACTSKIILPNCWMENHKSCHNSTKHRR